MTIFGSLNCKQRIILVCIVFGMTLGFIVDNTLLPPIVEFLKNVFGVDKIYLYTTEISIKVLSTALGIYLGFVADRWKKRQELIEDLVKILPLVEFEIRTNYTILKENHVNKLEKNSFMLDYWDMYRDEVAQWTPINKTVLIEIYGLLKRWRSHNDRKGRIMQNSVKIIETWVDWYASELKSQPPSSAHKLRTQIIEQLENLDLNRYKTIALTDMQQSKKYNE